MMRFKLLVLMALTPFLTSCASYFLKKECEKQNWYQVGYDAALRGERISNDDWVNKCRKVEAPISESQLDLGFKAGMDRYCQPDGAYQTGKAGDHFNSDFCDSARLPVLTQRHREGVQSYCGDGMSAGTSGKKYKNLCPANLEKTFLPEYKKGRKKYLTGLIATNDEKIQVANQDLYRLQQDKLIADRRLAILPAVKAGEQDPFKNERDSLSSQSSQINSQIYKTNSDIKKWRDENSLYKQEMITLD